MTALSANKQRPVRSHHPENNVSLGVSGYTNHAGGSTAHTIYKGALCWSNVSATDGYVSSDLDYEAAASGDIFVGIAMDTIAITSSDTSDGAKNITLARDGIWGFAIGSLSVTDLGAAAYASDNDTITSTSSNNQWVGIISSVDSTYVYVDISLAAGRQTDAL